MNENGKVPRPRWKTWWERCKFHAAFLVYLARTYPGNLRKFFRAQRRAKTALKRRTDRVPYNWKASPSLRRFMVWTRVELDIQLARDAEYDDIAIRSLTLQTALDLWIKEGLPLAMFRGHPRDDIFVRVVRMYRKQLSESRHNGGPFLIAYAENNSPLPL